MKPLLGLIAWFMVAGVPFAQTDAKRLLMDLRVVDEAGKPVANAEACLLRRESVGGWLLREPLTEPAWVRTDARGRAFLYLSKRAAKLPEIQDGQKDSSVASVELLLSAPGFPPFRERIAGFKQGMSYVARLKRGRPFVIALRNRTGKPLPADIEIAVLAGDTVSNLFEFSEVDLPASEEWFPRLLTKRIHTQFGAQRLAPGRYRINVPASWSKPLLVVVHRPGFLRGFIARIAPEAIARGRAEVVLPKPSTVKAVVNLSRARLPQCPYKSFQVALTLMGDIGGREGRFGMTFFSKKLSPALTQFLVTLDDLPPGEFLLELAGVQANPIGNPMYQDRHALRLQPGSLHKVNLAYVPADLQQYQGELEVTLRITRADGSPAGGKPFTVRVYDKRHGHLKFAEGTLDSAGSVVLKGLREKISYDVYVEDDQDRIGYLYLEPGEKTRAVDLRIPPRAGDSAPDVPLIDIETGKQIRLSDLRGKWVYIDFWATWCGPCRGAMEMLKREAPHVQQEYGDRVLLITLSIDDTASEARKYLQEEGLLGVCRHFWAGEGGWHSVSASAFGILGIPASVLIDPEGKVAWRGDPREGLLQILHSRVPEPTR